MFTARPNVLRSAIAVALSSFVLPPVKAAQDVKVKLTGYDHTKGQTYTRQMVFTFGDTPADAASVSFIDEAVAEYTSTFFGSQLTKHNFEVLVATRQNPDKTATGYTTILKYDDKEVIGLAHELAEGTLKLMVNPALKNQLDTVKELLVPEGGGDEMVAPKSPLLNPLTDASNPEAFGRLLEALHKTVTEKNVVLQETSDLEEVSSFQIPKVTTTKTPFLRQEVHGVLPNPDPETMLQDSASIFPDPEQSMSIMTTGMIHSIIPVEDASPLAVATDTQSSMAVATAPVTRKPLPIVVNELLTARPLVSFVTTELTSQDVVNALPKNYPVLTFGNHAGQVVLNLDQTNPAALTWIKGATRGIHTGYESLKIIHVDAPELREACYKEQAIIIRRVAKNGIEISDDDIGLLSHYQQLISVLDFVITRAKDFTLTKAMLQQIHLTGRGIHLLAHLAETFSGVDDVKAVVYSDRFSRRLQDGVECCASTAQLTDDDDLKKLVLHETVRTHRAVHKFSESSPDAQAEAKVLGETIGKLQEQVDDMEVPKLIDPKLTRHHFDSIPEDDEATYNKLSEAAKQHRDVPSQQLKTEWQAAKKLSVRKHGQPDIKQKVTRLAGERDKVAAFLTPDGKVKTGREEQLKAKITELGFDGEQDSEIVVKMVHTIPAARMVKAYEDALVLERVDLEGVHENTITVAQTGTDYRMVTRVKRVAKSHPQMFQNTQEVIETRQWLAEMATPTDLPKDGSIDLLIKDHRVLAHDIHQQLRLTRELLRGENKLFPARDLSRKLVAVARLMSALEDDTGHPGLLDAVEKQHATLQGKALDIINRVWFEDQKPQELDKDLRKIPGAMDHRNLIIAVIKVVNPGELAILRAHHKTFAPLHRQQLLKPEALELGQFELSALKKIKRATMLIPHEVTATQARLDSIQQQLKTWNTQTVELVTEVISWGTMLTETELTKLPLSADIASPEMVEAIQEYMTSISLKKASPETLLAMITSTEAVIRVAPSPADPLKLFLHIKENWEAFNDMIDRTASAIKSGQLEAFKRQLATAGMQDPTDDTAHSVARFILNATNQDTVENYCLSLQALKRTVADLSTLSEARILQAKLNFSAERIAKARQLIAAQPEAYDTLVAMAKLLHEKASSLQDITDLVEETTGDSQTPVFKQIQTMQKTVEALKSELEDMTTAKDKGTRDKTKLQAEYDELKSTLEAIEESVTKAAAHSDTARGKTTLPEKVAALSEELKTLKTSHQLLTSAHQIVKTSEEKAEARVQEVEKQINEMQEQIRAKDQEFKKLQREQRQAKQTEDELKKLLPLTAVEKGEDSLVDRATALSEKVTRQQREVDQLTKQLSSQEKQTKTSSSSSSSGDENPAIRLRKALTEAENKLQEQKRVAQAVDDKLNTLAHKHQVTLTGDTLEAKAQSLQEGLNNKAELLQEMEAKVRELEQTRTELEDLLKPKTRSTSPTDKPPAKVNLPQAVNELQEGLAEHHQSIQRLQIELQQKNEGSETLKQHITTSESTLNKAKTMLTEKTAEFDEISKKIETTAAKVTTLESKYPGLKLEGTLEERARQQLEEMESTLTQLKLQAQTLEKDLRKLLQPTAPASTDTSDDFPALTKKTIPALVQDLMTELEQLKKPSAAQVVQNGAKREYEDLKPKVEVLERQITKITAMVSNAEETASLQELTTELDLPARVRRLLLTPEKSQITTLANKLQAMTEERDLRASELEDLTKKAKLQETDLTEQYQRQSKISEAMTALREQLKKMTGERETTQETLDRAEETVKAFEEKHQAGYKPDSGDDLPVRVKKAVDYAAIKTEEAQTEVTRLQGEVEQHQTQLDYITRAVDHAVPDEPGGSQATPKKTTLNKIHQLSQEKTNYRQETLTLKEKVHTLELTDQLTTTGDGTSQLKSEFLKTKQQLFDAETELENSKTKLGAVKQELKHWEDTRSITPADEEDVVARTKVLTGQLAALENEVTTAQTHLTRLTASKGHVETLLKNPVRIHPADLQEGMPVQTHYDTLAAVATKHSFRSDELLLKLQNMERMVLEFEKEPSSTYRVVLNKIKDNMALVETFRNPAMGDEVRMAKFDEFAQKVDMPQQLLGPFTRALASIGLESWAELLNDVQFMKSKGLSPATVALPHLTMAKSGLTFADLHAVFDAAKGIENYEDIYPSLEAQSWLQHVDHPIPLPEVLAQLPTPDVAITLNEFNTLRMFLRRHNPQPTVFPALVDKLQKIHQWTSVSGSVEIDQQTFDHLKSAISGIPTGGSVDDLAIQIKASGQGDALRAVISVVDTLKELKFLLEDANELKTMVQAGKVIPETLMMAFHNTPPAVVRMAQVAVKGAPEYYRQRYQELQQQAIKRQAMGVLNTSGAVGILAGDDSVELLGAMGDSGSGIYNVLKAIPGQLHAGNVEDIRVIHHHLTLVSDLITGDGSVDEPVLAGLVKAFGEAQQHVNARGRVTNSDAYDLVLQNNNLGTHKRLVTRICGSGITPATVQIYVNQAVEIRKHHPRMVSLGVFQAAYQPEWTAEQFKLVSALAETPEIRLLAKDAHPVSDLRDLTSQIHEMEAASAEFKQLVNSLQDLDQQKLQQHNRLAFQFEDLKARYREVQLRHVHPGDGQAEGIGAATNKIQSATTFGTLQTATEEFSQHPRVGVAKELVPLLQFVHGVLEKIPSADELEAMEQFDTGLLQDSADKWVKGVGESQLRNKELLPHMQTLSGDADGYLEMDDVAEQYTQIFSNPSEPEITTDETSATTDEAIPSPKSSILLVVDAQEKMEELFQIQQKVRLDTEDFGKAKELAATLSDEAYRYSLELWTGSAEDTIQTLQEHVSQLQTAGDAVTAKDYLDEVFRPAEIRSSRELNAHLRTAMDELKKAEPHVPVYYRTLVQYGSVLDADSDEPRTRTCSDALQETMDDIADIVDQKKDHLTPEFVAAAPKPVGQESTDSDTDEPEISEFYRSATRMLGVSQEVAALEELKTVSEEVDSIEKHRVCQSGDGDIDPTFANERQQVITELEGFCEKCAAQKWLPPGTFEDLHEQGKVRPTRIIHATDQLDTEINHRKTAISMLQTMDEHGSPRLSKDMITHVRVLSVLSEMAEEAIPSDFKEVVVLVREMHGVDPSITRILESMQKTKQFRLGAIPQTIQDRFAAEQRWQLLVDFINGEDTIGELGQDVDFKDMVNEAPASQIKLSKRVATNMASSRAHDAQLRQSIRVLTELTEPEEMQAALFMKKAEVEVGFSFETRPVSPEWVKQQLKSAYGDMLPDSEATVMSNVIFRGVSVSPDSWDKVETALGKMPKSSPKFMSGAMKQIMNVDLQLAQSLLDVNDAFHRWLASDPLPRKMVTAVHNYQLKVEDIEEVRTYRLLFEEQRSDPTAFKAANKRVPEYPKAAHMLQLTEEDMHRLAELPERRWQKSVIAIANDPGKKSAAFALTQSLKNSVDVSTRFILEFILDDINLYGGTGTIAVILGYADSTLNWMGIDRDAFIRVALHAYTNGLYNPRFQQFASRWITPFTSGFQVVRVAKDIQALAVPIDVSIVAGALRSISFLLLAELNDLTWGGDLTKRMALAFRGMDQLVDVQILLEDRIKRARNRYARGKITKTEMQHIIKQDLANIELLAKGGDNWREDCKAVVETLRGDDSITDSDIDLYIEYINSSYSYQNIKKTWEECVATVSAVLSKGRPLMTPFTSSLPKYMILAGVVDPMVRYGLNAVAPGVAGTLGKVPAALLGTSIPLGPVTLPPAVLGTIAVSAGTTMYDGAYNDFELTRQTWYPFAEFVDTHVYGFDYEKSRQLGVEKPATWANSLNDTLPWLSMSAPNNMWLNGAKQLVGDKYAHKVFGHKQSALGYSFRPFTYTYEKILDHFYKHPPQQIKSVGPEALDAPDPVPAGSSLDIYASTSGMPAPTSATSILSGSTSSVILEPSPTPDTSVNQPDMFRSDDSEETIPTISPSASLGDLASLSLDAEVIHTTDEPPRFAGNLKDTTTQPSESSDPETKEDKTKETFQKKAEENKDKNLVDF